MNTPHVDRLGPVEVNCGINSHSALRSLSCHRLGLLIPCILMMAGAGCRITAPRPDMEATVHAREDVAATPQQIRLRMRALVEPLSGVIIESADQISAATTNRVVRREALLWKIEAVPALREALFRPNPFAAIMDTWVLTWQMTDYFESVRGREALGDAAPIAITACQYLENQIETVTASMMISGNVSDARKFAREWARTHPIRHSIASRESTLSRVTERELQESFSTQELAGNVVVTLDDLTRRMDVYSVQLLDQSRWQAELFAMDQAANYQLEKAMPLAESAVQSATEAVEVMEQLAPAVQDALAVAKSAPELVSGERKATIEAAQSEVSRTLQFIQAERIAALEYVTKEREAALLELQRSIVEQRALLTADVERISLKAVDHAMLRVAQLTGVILIAVFVGVVLLLLLTRRLFSGK
jgi:hypothetical protein